MDNFEKQIHSMFDHIWDCNIDHPVFEDTVGDLMEAVIQCYQNLTSAQPEKTEYIPDTKAVRSKRDCVDLAERVSATFYDQEYEEWTQQTVTIADVLDSVCDDYTVLPSAQPEIVRCKDCQWWERDSQPRYHSDEHPCIIVEMATSPEWFCADGERREE